MIQYIWAHILSTKDTLNLENLHFMMNGKLSKNIFKSKKIEAFWQMRSKNIS